MGRAFPRAPPQDPAESYWKTIVAVIVVCAVAAVAVVAAFMAVGVVATVAVVASFAVVGALDLGCVASVVRCVCVRRACAFIAASRFRP